MKPQPSSKADPRAFEKIMREHNRTLFRTARAILRDDAEAEDAYVDHEVVYHQQVLDAIDKVLIPSAQNAELKGLITKVRPAIAAHLGHAKHLQATLGKK